MVTPGLKLNSSQATILGLLKLSLPDDRTVIPVQMTTVNSADTSGKSYSGILTFYINQFADSRTSVVERSAVFSDYILQNMC